MSDDVSNEVGISRNEVLKIAKLGRLRLTDAEVDALGKDLNAILGYVAKMGELDTTGVPTLEHAAEFGDTCRDDENRPSLPREEALASAPRTGDGCFAVPKIIE
ncbi:MAG: Asp-tRNA(Asn)/Glu-tRNA(Gln) amidotransferase subunit GatC [Nitrospirota bacterium]|nr:Asp-tRNA(Asn)/Glu-tRNA(Gln) amidotransferase subunit GatC [Nitrospirota bacterium]